ncbi:MAG TPA: metalloregulator ArsR/SmtB family transcription factor [Kribbella sp.]
MNRSEPAATVVRSGRIAPTGRQLAAAARTFGLLSPPVRLQLVWFAANGEYDVGTLAARAGVSVATASQHLGKLRIAGLITVRRIGRRHIYTVDDPHVLALIDQIFRHIAPDGTLAPDARVRSAG